MGMFDSVWVTCPNCKNQIEFQSKVGDCTLHDYSIYDVPAQVAADVLYKNEICDSCNKKIKLYGEVTVQLNPLVLEE